jgi:Tol biopolymer transport system component
MGHIRHVAHAVAVGVAAMSAAPAAAASTRGGPAADLGVDRVVAGERAGSTSPAVSASGRYVAFTSSADDLVADDTNRSSDVFVRDRGTGRTERVSVGTGGGQARRAAGGSGQPAISGDGRYVAFTSAAPDLVAGDTNGAYDVFVRDRAAGKTVRVSVANGGAQARDDSGLPAMSADGRVVAFVSAARNLVAGDTNRAPDAFVRDLATGATQRVSVSASGAQVRHPVLLAAGSGLALSADGAIVAFASPSSELVPGDRNRADDVFVRDRTSGTTSLVSVDSGGAQRRLADSRAPSLSGDGRLVAFDSVAGFDAADVNRASDVYVRDRQVASTSWASPGSDRRGSDAPSLSGDGRYVLFVSRSPLLASDVDGFADVYRYDRTAATTTLTSIDSWYGRHGTGAATQPSSSATGLVVAFTSAGGLVPDDEEPEADVLEQVLDATRTSVSFLGLVSLPSLDDAPQPPISDVPAAGQVVYRVWGAGTRQFGASWTPVAPSGLGPDRYRYSTGLPDRLNSGVNVSVGTLDAASSVVLVRAALPLNPNDTFGIPEFVSSGVTYRSYTGGVIEYIIPGADAHVLNPQTQVADPAFGGVPPGCVPAPRGCVGDQAP